MNEDGNITLDNFPLIDAKADEDGSFPKVRQIFGLMSFLGFAVVYAMRVNLSVAIVAMVKQQPLVLDTNVSLSETCPTSHYQYIANLSDLQTGEFAWDEATQGLALGSFYYGYILTQIPGGRIAELKGGKHVYGIGVFVTALFSLLTPMAAYWNFSSLVLVRIFQGMGEGVTYPAMHAMLAHWIPPSERSKFASIVYAGSNIGTVVSMPLTGWLCSLSIMNGWPLAFYVFGFLGLVWFVFWMFLVYDKPSAHPHISYKEREYIESSIQLHSSTFEFKRGADKNIPWSSIFTSSPVWAILITQCGGSWAFYTQLSELPTYMSNILHFDIESNAVLNAIPYLTSWVVGILCSTLADWLLSQNYISLVNSFRLWNSIASIVPSIGLAGVTYAGCSWKWVTFMLAGFGSFQGAVYAGSQMNHIVLSPRFAGTMYGITNTAANVCGFMAPYVTGLIITRNETMAQWKIVFCVAAVINVVGNFIYIIFASAEEQHWSKPKKK